jgi:hypothetical protein
MLSPADIVSDLFEISRLIYEQMQLVKANKHHCQRLYDRIMLITSTLKSLEKIPDMAHYRLGLLRVLQKNCQKMGFQQEEAGSHR